MSLTVRAASFIERHALLAKFYILTFCAFYLHPGIAVPRNLFYFAVLPLFALSVDRTSLTSILRSPLLVATASYFCIVVVAALLAGLVVPHDMLQLARNAVLILLFVTVTAWLAARDADFSARLFLFASACAAIMAVINIWLFYGGFAPGGLPRRLEGLQGVTVYFNPDWIAAIYGTACAGAAAVAIRPGLPRATRILLAAAAAILYVAVVLTQTRHVIIAVTLSFLAIAAFGAGRLSARQRWIAGAAVMIAGGALLLWLALATTILESFVARGDSFRFLIWKGYWAYAIQHPWIGIGISAETAVVAPNGFPMPHAHNAIFDALVRSGVFGAAALVAIYGLTAYQAGGVAARTGDVVPLALFIAALGPTLMDVGTVIDALGRNWIVFWLPIGLCIGATFYTANSDTRASGRAGARKAS